jgi:hypothetical protein
MNTEINYYFPIIVAAAIVSIVWMYITMKRAPQVDEEDKVVNITLNITKEEDVKPKRVYKRKTKKVEETPVVKKRVGRPKKTNV